MKRGQIISWFCIITLAVLGYGCIYAMSGKTCPFLWLTGISCPGCGMTRAVIALAHMDVAGALHYHPLVFCLPVFVYIPYCVVTGKTGRQLSVTVIAVVSAFVCVYGWRMYSGSDVLQVHVQDGLLYKVLSL